MRPDARFVSTATYAHGQTNQSLQRLLLKEICLPKLLKRPSVHDYIRRQTGEEEP